MRRLISLLFIILLALVLVPAAILLYSGRACTGADPCTA